MCPMRSESKTLQKKKEPVYVNVCYLMPLFISYTSCDVRKYKQMVINSESKHNSYSTYCLRRARKTNIYFLSICILIEVLSITHQAFKL